MHAQFFRGLDQCSAALHKFNPDLLVVFGPDHFNGFFYELMPMFCIGSAAQSSKDWHLEPGPLKVPRDTAIDCVRYLHGRDFDEVRTWVAAAAAAKAMGKLQAELKYYHLVPEWITGMGIVVGQA